MAVRIWFKSGVCANFTYTSVPPLKSTPNGIPCQKKMDKSPATLNTSEKARKYHFLPRKSMFVFLKNSTASPLRKTQFPSCSLPVNVHHGGTEDTEFYKILLMIPWRKAGTLKLIKSPTCTPLSLKYVINCASCTGWKRSIDFSSTTTLSSTSRSIRYPLSSRTPLYSTGMSTCDRKGIPLSVSSRHMLT